MANNYTSQVVPVGSAWTISAGDTASFTSVYGGYFVNSGASDISAKIFAGGQETVSGGIAAKTTVGSGGFLTVCFNGYGTQLVAKKGMLNVYSGGSARDVSLFDQSVLTVSAGASVYGIAANYSYVNVYDQATVSSIKVINSATLSVYDGGTAKSVTISGGASFNQFTQGTASATIADIRGKYITGAASGLNGSGFLYASTGAALNDTALTSGKLTLAGGTASNTTLKSGASMVVSNGASALLTTLSSGAVFSAAPNAKTGLLTVLSGARVQSFTQLANSGSIAGISSGFVSGAVQYITFQGTMSAGSGANLGNVTVQSGNLILSSNATAARIGVNQGALNVYAGATVNSVYVRSGGSLALRENASATNVVLSSGGTIGAFTQTGASAAVIQKATCSGLTGTANQLSFTGTLNLLAGGSADGMTVSRAGAANLQSGAYAKNATILNGGLITVSKGGFIADAAVQSGAALAVQSGGVATGIRQSAGGGVITTIAAGDNATHITGTNEFGSFGFVNGSASNFVLYAGNTMIVSSGAKASNILIRNGGFMSASVAAYLTGSSVDMGMRFSISNGVLSGLNTLVNFELGIDKGYMIDGQTIGAGGVQTVKSNGVASNTKLIAGGKISVEYNGSALNVSQGTGGIVTADVFNSAANTRITGTNENGSFFLASGSAVNFILSSGADLILHSGAEAYAARIDNGGRMVVSSGASATSIVQRAGGAIEVNVRGNDELTLVSGYSEVQAAAQKDAGVVPGSGVILGGMYLGSGVASGFFLENGGQLNVSSGGQAFNNVVGSGGGLSVEYGASVSSTYVSSAGLVSVFEDGVLNTVTIEKGASLNLAKGAILKGTVNLSGQIFCVGGNVTADNTAISIDFSSRSTSDSFMIDNMGALSNARFLLTVSANSDSGTYRIASNTYSFSRDLIVYNTDGEYYGTFTASVRDFSVDGMKYILSNTAGGDLNLVVRSAKVHGDLNGDGTGDIVVANDITGKAGYFTTSKYGSTAYVELNRWNNANASDWTVAGIGRFSGSTVAYDGILLYNESTNTFGAWTDVSATNYGFVTLGQISDADLSVDSIGNFDGNSYDDAVLSNDDGSFGILADGMTYHEVWHSDSEAANTQILQGAGFFGNTDGSSDLIVFNSSESAFYRWSNNDKSYQTADWTKTKLASRSGDWAAVAVGDFSNDTIDDIVLFEKSTGALYLWDNADASTERVIGYVDPDNWDLEGVADYNGDGKDDILFREDTTGRGNLCAWSGADSSKLIDLNANAASNLTTLVC